MNLLCTKKSKNPRKRIRFLQRACFPFRTFLCVVVLPSSPLPFDVAVSVFARRLVVEHWLVNSKVEESDPYPCRKQHGKVRGVTAMKILTANGCGKLTHSTAHKRGIFACVSNGFEEQIRKNVAS